MLIKETKNYKKYSLKINKINKIENDCVYDIEVEEEHKLVANGFYTSNCTHPDIEEFITVKSDYTRIQNANISCQITDDFYKAVEKDKDWDLMFEIPEVKKGQKVFIDVHSIDKDCLYDKQSKRWYKIASHDRPLEKIKKTVKAKKLLELIAKNMANNAEPGIQNIDIARKYSNSDYLYDPKDEYDSRILSSNAPVVGSTLIPTKDGIFPIKDLYEKDENILVLSDTMTTFPKELINCNPEKVIWGKYNFPSKTIPVIAKFKKYKNQKVWNIKLDDGMVLKCNAEHKWLINGEMIETKNIKVNDKLYRPNGGIVQAFDLTIDKQSNDYKEGQLIGYIVGNNCVEKKDNSDNETVDALYNEDYMYKYYSELLNEIKTNKTFEVGIENQNFIDYIESFCFKDNQYIVPKKCFENLEFCAGFLSGIFQVDSYIKWNSKQGKIVLITVPENIAYQVMSLLMNWFGINSTIKKNRTKDVKYDLIISDREKIIRFKELIGLIGNKKEILQQVNNDCQQYNNRISSKVISVFETNEREDMYCAVVNGLHSFVVDGYMSSNCSEQYLSRESLCVLASINMGKFSTIPDEYKKELEIVGESINRFLDNVNTCELVYKTYATPHQKLAIEKLRRTGAGMTNFAGWFFKNNVEYGSPESITMAEEFTKYFTYNLYKSSQKLGKEKGNFGLFNKEKLIKSPFIIRLMKEFPDLTFNNLRNVTTISIAPTGCTIKETKIQTDKGIKSFEEIFTENGIDITEIEKNPDKQWFDLKTPLFAKDLEGNYNKISKLYYNGFSIISVLKFEDETQFTATPNHKVLIVDKNNPEYGIWKQLDELKEGDEIVFENN